jgi:hypothetical protein
VADQIPWPLPLVLTPEQALQISLEVSRVLLLAGEQPPAPEPAPQPVPVIVHPAQPLITVQPADVTVAPPTITVQPAQPAAPVINVQTAAPMISVQPAEVSVQALPPIPPNYSKLRFLHVRDGYVSYDQITAVKVEAIAAQPFQIAVTLSDGSKHLWSETFKERAQADLALDRIVWALSL